MREPEPDVVSRARAGDLRAFESLVREYQADVWRFAYHLTRNRASADDVTQEAFLRAFRGIGTYSGRSKFTSWLLRITRNSAVDLYRRTRREEPSSLEHVEQTAAPATGPEERMRIWDAIGTLPPDLREPFVTIEVLGFSYPEASTILGVKVGTIKSRMHRARAILIRALSEEAAGEV